MRDSFNSIDVLAEEVRDQLATQLGHFESLDAKAGMVLGFAGLLVALVPVDPSGWIATARFAAVVSAIFALSAFTPRDYPLVDVEGFRTRYLGAEPVFTRLALLDTRLVMLKEFRVLGTRKARRLQVSIAALLTATAIASVGVVTFQQGGHHERRPVEPDRAPTARSSRTASVPAGIRLDHLPRGRQAVGP